MITDEDDEVREAAALQTTDQQLLRIAALHDRDDYVRIAALGNLTCKTTLRQLAVSEEAPQVRAKATERLKELRTQRI